MQWFNSYGFFVMVVIMIPNIIFAITQKEGFVNKYSNKMVEAFEQIGRIGSLVFMILNVPYVTLGYWFQYGKITYITVIIILCFLYCLIWSVYWNRKGLLKSLFLSVIPSMIFLLSGILLLHIPLIITSILFAIGHIIISYKNTVL